MASPKQKAIEVSRAQQSATSAPLPPTAQSEPRLGPELPMVAKAPMCIKPSTSRLQPHAKHQTGANRTLHQNILNIGPQMQSPHCNMTMIMFILPPNLEVHGLSAADYFPLRMGGSWSPTTWPMDTARTFLDSVSSAPTMN